MASSLNVIQRVFAGGGRKVLGPTAVGVLSLEDVVEAPQEGGPVRFVLRGVDNTGEKPQFIGRRIVVERRLQLPADPRKRVDVVSMFFGQPPRSDWYERILAAIRFASSLAYQGAGCRRYCRTECLAIPILGNARAMSASIEPQRIRRGVGLMCCLAWLDDRGGRAGWNSEPLQFSGRAAFPPLAQAGSLPEFLPDRPPFLGRLRRKKSRMAKRRRRATIGRRRRAFLFWVSSLNLIAKCETVSHNNALFCFLSSLRKLAWREGLPWPPATRVAHRPPIKSPRTSWPKRT